MSRDNMTNPKTQKPDQWQKHARRVRIKFPRARLFAQWKGDTFLGWRIVDDRNVFTGLHFDDEAAWLEAAEKFA